MILGAAAGSVLTLSLGSASLALAAHRQPGAPAHTTRGGGHAKIPGGMGVHGTVSAISGTVLTVESVHPKSNATSTFTVDASNATVMKIGSSTKPASSTVASIVTGDSVTVLGSISGQTIKAKMIIDGPIPMWGKRGKIHNRDSVVNNRHN